MNNDSLKSLIIKLLIMTLTALAAKLHLSTDANSIATIATDLADLGVLLWGVYDHWGMIKVPAPKPEPAPTPNV